MFGTHVPLKLRKYEFKKSPVPRDTSVSVCSLLVHTMKVIKTPSEAAAVEKLFVDFIRKGNKKAFMKSYVACIGKDSVRAIIRRCEERSTWLQT